MLWSLESLWGCCTPSKPQQRPAPHSGLSWAPGTSCLCCSCGARPDLPLASHPCPCSLSQELFQTVAAKGLVGAMVSPAPWQRTSAQAVRDTGGLGLPTWMHWVSLSQLLPWLPKELPYPLQEVECSPMGPQARRALCRMRKPAWPAGRVISHLDSLQIPLFLPRVPDILTCHSSRATPGGWLCSTKGISEDAPGTRGVASGTSRQSFGRRARFLLRQRIPQGGKVEPRGWGCPSFLPRSQPLLISSHGFLRFLSSLRKVQIKPRCSPAPLMPRLMASPAETWAG